MENNDVGVNQKKRGRKPKGGKITNSATCKKSADIPKIEKENVILHLKCSMSDLNYSKDVVEGIESSSILSYDVLNNSAASVKKPFDNVMNIKVDHKNNDIFSKLKILENSLHFNEAINKSSSCFWCTETFDNPAIFLPKMFLNTVYHVYGCFCTPECAVAFLMQEKIDTSCRNERYFLLNQMYGKIYNYSKNIKPAPSPFYMLNKFMGNLSIAEYRELLKSEKIYLLIDKPISRIMPEYHEDNDEYIITSKIIPTISKLKSKLYPYAQS